MSSLSICGYFLKKVLLRNNSHTIKFHPFKVYNPLGFGAVQSCAKHHTNLILSVCSSSPKEILYLLALSIPSSQAPSRPSTFCLYGFAHFRSFGKRNQIICGLLQLTSFILASSTAVSFML